MTAAELAQSLLATLPGHHYTVPSIFALDQSRMFEAGWSCAVRSADLSEPGAFQTVQVGRESVLIARDRKGNLNAFLEVCRHRGARLCTEEAGQVQRSLRCPCHAWTCGLDGRLIAAPNLGGMPRRVRPLPRPPPGTARLRLELPGR